MKGHGVGMAYGGEGMDRWVYDGYLLWMGSPASVQGWVRAGVYHGTLNGMNDGLQND
jgi:hypothetical protein